MANLRLALDEGVSHPVAWLLRSRGYDADSAKELHRLGFSDVQVLVHATNDGRIVVTHNRKDFVMLHEAWIVFRQRWTAETQNQSGISLNLSLHGGILIVPPMTTDEIATVVGEFDDKHGPIDGLLFGWNADSGWKEEPIRPRTRST